jgi:adenylate cyclase
MPVSRRLVAVVFADVAGYSRLMERDESGTHQRMRDLDDQLIAPKIVEHGGRTVHTAGDGMLLEFSSTTSALRWALEIQREMGARNFGEAPDTRIEFRIGINLGDVIVEGSDLIGDGVNVAARLEALARPGEICVSSAVREQVHEDLGVEFIDAGEQRVKNISKPIRVFRVAVRHGATAKMSEASRAAPTPTRRFSGQRVAIIAGALALLAALGAGIWQWTQRPAHPTPAAIAGPPPRSILVAHFNAPAGDAPLTALADTLGGDVARALANSVRDAHIVAPGFAATQQGTPFDERALAREANVRYLVAGDVRAAGGDIAVTVRLTDGTTAKQLSSERRTIARARATEDRDLLVARVTAAVRLMFQNAEGRRIAAEPGSATDAQSLVTRANAVFTGEDRASTLAARRLFEEARERDPSLVAAWTGHLLTLSWEHWNDFAAGRNERLVSEMDRDSRRAIALDDRDPTAWSARAAALAVQWQWQAAFEANDRAIALDPTQPRFDLQRSFLYYMTGRSAEALQQIAKRNAALGPPDSDFLFYACHAHIHLGQYEEALAKCGRAVARDNSYLVYFDLAAAYAQTGDMVRARAAKADLMRRAPDFTISRFEAKQFSNNPVWIEEVRTRFIPGLRKAGVPED